ALYTCSNGARRPGEDACKLRLDALLGVFRPPQWVVATGLAARLELLSVQSQYFHSLKALAQNLQSPRSPCLSRSSNNNTLTSDAITTIITTSLTCRLRSCWPALPSSRSCSPGRLPSTHPGRPHRHLHRQVLPHANPLRRAARAAAVRLQPAPRRPGRRLQPVPVLLQLGACSVRSATVWGSQEPRWGEGEAHCLYVRDPRTEVLRVRLYDEDPGPKSDDELGTAMMWLGGLLEALEGQGQGAGGEARTVTLPLR
ncbi:hypothetical protein Agub_g7918, partial [Astrephomene gubernaculifera]